MPGNPYRQDQNLEYEMNPYESFMRNHLRHYGYYTGRNEGYRTSVSVFEDWERTHDYNVTDNESETEYENQALKDDKDDLDGKFQEDINKTTQLVFSYQAGKMVPKLREPRNLYALTKEQGAQHAARWPSVMEVIPERVLHIADVATSPEPFYQPTGSEKMPMPASEGEGRVVFYCPPPKETYFLRSRVGGNRNGCSIRAVKLNGPEDTTLVFESRFESGNLYKAVQRTDNEYELHLRYDLYTKKHTQWYYFRVHNARPGIRYRFTIINLMKPDSLYNRGMRPLLYSELDAVNKKLGWRRWGEEIKYYRNTIRRTNVKGDKYFYSLTWTCTFPNANDMYYFAHCYPYTYSDLQSYLLNLQNDPVRSRFCKQRVLCRTLAGNLVYVLTITSPSVNPQHSKSKRAVVLTARVHPGETPASWMMKGLLDYLVGDSADAKLLRDTFVFKVIPMLNPDGVIVGNYRCSLAGRDLNRNYKSVLKDSFPSVCHCKMLIRKIMEERDVIVYCDLHGHSRKQNVFIYGCENRHDPVKRLRERIFPFILNKNAPDKFSFQSCKFKVQKSKEGTGRVVMWQMGIMNSFTMEATFCGSSMGKKARYHFSTTDYEAMGYHFCDSLLDYCDPDNSKAAHILYVLEERVRQEILAHLRMVGSPIPDDVDLDRLNDEYMSAVESSTSGSDSSADDGLPVHLLAIAPKLQKKKKLKTRKERDKKRNTDKYENRVEEKTDSPLHVNEKEGSASSKRDERVVASKIVRYQHILPKDSHSSSRLNYNRHDNMYEGKDEGKKTEYLEAITNAYLKNGILPPGGEKEVPTFRYTAGQRGASSGPIGGVDGLCPHHEKTFAAQYVANHLSDLQFADDQYEWGHTHKSVEDLVQHGSSAARSRSRQHVVALSAVQQRQQDLLQLQHLSHHQSRPSTGHSSPIKTHPSPFDEQFEAGRPSPEYTDFVKRGYSAGKTRTSHPNSRCPSATQISYPQLSKSQQYQQHLQRQQQQQLLQQQQQQQQQQQCYDDQEESHRKATKHNVIGQTLSASEITSCTTGMTGSSSNIHGVKRSGRVSRTGHYSVDSDLMTSEIESHTTQRRYSASTSDSDDPPLHKHKLQSSTTMATSSKSVTMTTSETKSSRGRQATYERLQRKYNEEQPSSNRGKRRPIHSNPCNQTDLSVPTTKMVTMVTTGHHSQEEEKERHDQVVERLHSNVACQIQTNNNNNSNKPTQLAVTKLATETKNVARIQCESTEATQPTYPIERGMGSSHHFRRAESLTQCSESSTSPSYQNKVKPRRSVSSGGHVTMESTPEDRIEEQEFQQDDELCAGSSYVQERHQTRTPVVTEPATISLTLGDTGYSHYDRFGGYRRHTRPPLLRFHPKRH
ncbi:cytosolic carboxypeptidase 2-like [Glandiceps talaboti]